MTTLVLPSLLAIIFAAAVSAITTRLIRPLLVQYALARSNVRSSHRVPTPQGAGIAVIAATLIVGGIIVAIMQPTTSSIPVIIFVATAFIGIVGISDDIRPISVIPRLVLQAITVAAILYVESTNVQIFPSIPLWVERTLLLLAGLWFVNLVNFMDGLDLMTAAEVVPVTGTLVILGAMGSLPATVTIVAAALGGAMLGFVPYNRPVAKMFLGDVGSLPIGLLLGWCLLELTYKQHLTAALLLPLYYLADATVTLVRRLSKRERVWAAHRSHFYQRATDNGFTVLRVVGEVFVLNVGLAALAIVSVAASSTPIDLALFIAGSLAVAFTMFRFSRQRQAR